MDAAPGGMGQIRHRVCRRLKGKAPASANQAVREPEHRQRQIDNGPPPAYLDGETSRRLNGEGNGSRRMALDPQPRPPHP